MYRASHNTSGMDTVSHATVMFDTVWHHPGSLISDGDGGATSAAALETARLARDFVVVGEDFRSGDVGAGDAVEVRDRVGFLVGEGSKAGKSPWGWLRVDTIFTVQRL
jgi:hypothetical protein